MENLTYTSNEVLYLVKSMKVLTDINDDLTFDDVERWFAANQEIKIKEDRNKKINEIIESDKNEDNIN
jgi:hypothetical protein